MDYEFADDGNMKSRRDSKLAVGDVKIGRVGDSTLRPASTQGENMARRYSKVRDKTVALRSKLWPDLSDDDLWKRKEYDGFTSIPRTMPIIMNIIDDLTKGAPASSTYFSVWCKAYDEMYVSLANPEELAFHAGFSGQRAVRTWQSRLKSLAEIGFIRIAAGPRGGYSHVAIPNPHFIIRRLYRDEYPGLTQMAYNTLVERANEVGAMDMEKELPEEKAERERLESESGEVPF